MTFISETSILLLYQYTLEYMYVCVLEIKVFIENSQLILSLRMFISKVLMPIFIPRPLSNQKCFPNIKFAPNKYKLCNGWEFARSRQKSRYWILLLLQFHKRKSWFDTKNTKICMINNFFGSQLMLFWRLPIFELWPEKFWRRN